MTSTKVQDKFSAGGMQSDRGQRKGQLSQAGASQLGSQHRMKSEFLGTARYSKLSATGMPDFGENSVAFKIGPGQDIPEASIHRTTDMRAERMNSLQRVPKHKPAAARFNGDAATRTIAPLTYEDLGHFNSLSLISTLRVDGGVTKKPNQSSYAAPPSFFEDDMMKHATKYQKVVAERQVEKKHLQKTIDMNQRTVANNNVHHDSEFFDAEKRLKDETLYTGGQIKPTQSEFKRVLVRRKSRLSVNGPVNVDFDHRGDTAKFQHLITKDANMTTLDFGLNLRNYRNSTQFTAKEPFLYPPKREFQPTKQFETLTETMADSNKHFIHNKFQDKVGKEKNHNHLRHMKQTGPFSAVNWQCNLRERADGFGEKAATAKKTAKVD